jgi:hypothetical protein
MMENILTPERVDEVIKEEKYFRVEGTGLTICVLTLENGFNVLGQSAPADPVNFDEETGAKIAFTKAKEKIWELEGYLLKQRLFEESKNGN